MTPDRPYSSINESEELPRKQNVDIPFNIYREISLLIGEHINLKLENRERASIFINFMLGEKSATDKNDWYVQYWWDTTEFFMRHAHENGDNNMELTQRKQFIEKFENFESILFSLIREFYDTTETLDAILEETNTRTN